MMETKACWVSFLLFSLYFQLVCTFISLSTLKSRTAWVNQNETLLPTWREFSVVNVSSMEAYL